MVRWGGAQGDRDMDQDQISSTVGALQPDDRPPELPGWWIGLQSIMLMLVLILTLLFIFDRLPTFTLGDTPVGWLLLVVWIVVFLLGIVAIFFAVFGGLGTLASEAALWVYRSRWRGQAATRAEVTALRLEVRTLRQEADGGNSQPMSLAAHHQKVGATDGTATPAPAMRTEAGDDAAADLAAHVATEKAAAKLRRKFPT